MQSESSKQFRQGVGRARALMRQTFVHWPGVPIVDRSAASGPSINFWRSWSETTRRCHEATIDGRRLQEIEQTLNRLVHHHRDHLATLLPDAGDWLERVSNCLELLKEFLHKPPAEQPAWPNVIERMALPARYRQAVIDLAERCPQLRPFLWHICFLDLTSPQTIYLPCLPWIEAHAAPLAALVQRDDGIRCALQLTRIGPWFDQRWLNTVFEFLATPDLGSVPFAESFSYADELAQTLRDLLNGKPGRQPKRPEAPTLADKFVEHLDKLAKLKPSRISKTTALLAALVGQELGQFVLGLWRRSQQEEKRLAKLLLKVEQLGVQSYVDSVGLHLALKGAHVLTNLRQEGQSLLGLFSFAEIFCDNPALADRVHGATEFFGHVRELKVATRIHLAVEWERKGWPNVVKYLPPLNELLARRGVHAQLHRHWLRRHWPSIASQNAHVDLVASAVRDTGTTGWRRVLKLLEHLVYDRNERLTEVAVTALVKLAQAIPDLSFALELWRVMNVQVLAESTFASLSEAYWIDSDGSDFRMTLAWLNLHPEIAGQTFRLRQALQHPVHLDLLRRLLKSRDQAALVRWLECLEVLESCGAPMPTAEVASASPVWIANYPPAFHAALNQLAIACSESESVAQKILGTHCRSDRRLTSEIASLKERLSNEQWCVSQSKERLGRIGKRLANLTLQLAEPRALSTARTARLIEKLQQRADHELLEAIAHHVQRKLEAKLNGLNIEGLLERLRQPPYNRILPALRYLTSDQQQLAWHALGSSWDNSLKLVQEPANQQFLQRMTDKGLMLDAWLDSQLVVEGLCADGTSYRVAFTQDPLEILMMGHYFQTCLGLVGSNFYSTISNLVDANKRVVYGRTESGRLVGRCLFALSQEGQLKTFCRYQHCPEDGFDHLVDVFAAQLASALGTVQTDRGQVACLVSRSWYDDGCVALPDSASSRTIRLQEQLENDPHADPYTLAIEIFESEAALIAAAETMMKFGLFDGPRAVRSLFPCLARERSVALSLRLRLASMIWITGDRDLARSVLEGWLDREINRSLGRETLSNLIEQRGFADLMIDRSWRLAKRLLQRSRPSYVYTDEREESEMRCYMRDRIHLAASLRHSAS